MENLPIEVLTEIFSHFDNDSMWNALKVCRIWTEVFSSSSKLNEKFQLQITRKFIESEDCSNLPEIPIKNVSIADINTSEAPLFRLISEFIAPYRGSIETLTLSNVQFTTVDSLRAVLKSQQCLKHLRFTNIKLLNLKPIAPITLDSLQSISMAFNNQFTDSMRKLIELFKFSQNLEKIELIANVCNSNSLDYDSFDDTVKTLPKFRHLIMSGHGSTAFFNRHRFPFKLETFEGFALGFHWPAQQPRLDFLKSQLGSLKELRLMRLPFDSDGDEVLKFILEEMHLERFYYGDIPLLLNGRKQAIGDIWFSEATVKAGMEVLLQFPTIKSLRLVLSGCAMTSSMPVGPSTLPSNNFRHIQELKIVDNSRREFANCIDIFKACKNVQRLSIESKEHRLSELLSEFLPCMWQLEKFELSCDDFGVHERLQAVRECCLSVNLVKVKAEHLEIANVIFDGTADVRIDVL